MLLRRLAGLQVTSQLVLTAARQRNKYMALLVEEMLLDPMVPQDPKEAELRRLCIAIAVDKYRYRQVSAEPSYYYSASYMYRWGHLCTHVTGASWGPCINWPVRNRFTVSIPMFAVTTLMLAAVVPKCLTATAEPSRHPI